MKTQDIEQLEKLELGNIEKEKATVNGAGDEQAVNILEYEEEEAPEGGNAPATS